MKSITTEWLNKVVEEERLHDDGPLEIGCRKRHPMALPCLAVAWGVVLLLAFSIW